MVRSILAENDVQKLSSAKAQAIAALKTFSLLQARLVHGGHDGGRHRQAVVEEKALYAEEEWDYSEEDGLEIQQFPNFEGEVYFPLTVQLWQAGRITAAAIGTGANTSAEFKFQQISV
ncbi:hypothetical protein HDU87_001883 [Geranomyces variabilis]|uniref:Uncharacterized protein n=1 Tax=Geranomyces variabilis TaxID=109894 RepID=A0AAD5TBK6_9FUNG|nr:hypothetical protein HDU87_001883 [Geranomyces variabilis]